MLDHDLDELRAAKQRIGVAYAKARDVTGARMRTLDGMLADAMRLCVGSMPATQAKILASYAARFERMAERRSPAGRRGTRGARHARRTCRVGRATTAWSSMKAGAARWPSLRSTVCR